MLTRCPACQTVFRLRPEQLRARHGEVRCGHCFNPFNALEHLLENGDDAVSAPSPVASAPAPLPDPAPAVPSAPPVAAPSAFSDLDFDLHDDRAADLPAPLVEPTDTAPLTPTAAAAAEPEHPLDFDTAFDPWPHTLEPVVEPAPTEPCIEPTVEPSIVRAASIAHAEPAADEGAAAKPMAHIDPLEHEPRVDFSAMVAAAGSRLAGAQPAPAKDFDREPPALDLPAPDRIEPEVEIPSTDNSPELQPIHADEPTDAQALPAPDAPADIAHLDATYGPAQGTARSGLAGIGMTVLVLALLAQSAYLFRDTIARELPGLRPLYVAACARLGCDMPLPRDAMLINIDSPDLQSEPGRPGRYILHATIQNRAGYPQAWPHLELTLTDNSDAPLVRRVLTPAEWVAGDRLQGEFKARSDATVRLTFDAPEITPTGYRVYVFYP